MPGTAKKWAPTRPTSQRDESGKVIRVRVLRPGSQTKEAITDPEIMKAIDKAARSFAAGEPGDGGEAWAVVTILRKTGMHVSSFLTLRPENLSAGILAWNRPKTDKRLRAAVDAELAAALGIYFRLPRASRSHYHGLLRAVGKTAGVPRLAPMTFRHSRAVNLLNKGVSPIKICQLLGCSMQTLLRHYGAMTEQQLIESG